MQELAFTLANGIAYAQARWSTRLSPDEFGERFSFFNAHNHFFQEIAKFRAARRLWARIMKERFGVTNTKAQAMRLPARPADADGAAAGEQHRARCDPGASAVAGGAQSIHTNGFDEAWRCRRNGQDRAQDGQILAHEAGGTDTADPPAARTSSRR